MVWGKAVGAAADRPWGMLETMNQGFSSLWSGRVAAGLLLAATASGCVAPKGQPQAEPVAELKGAWTPRPVAMRIYPSTRFLREGGVPVLDARVELFDAMGDATKASGQARFELLNGPSVSEQGPPAVLYRWDITQNTLQDQQTYFDPITRSYAYPLRVDDSEVADRPVYLRVTFTLPAGERLSDEQKIRTSWTE